MVISVQFRFMLENLNSNSNWNIKANNEGRDPSCPLQIGYLRHNFFLYGGAQKPYENHRFHRPKGGGR